MKLIWNVTNPDYDILFIARDGVYHIVMRADDDESTPDFLCNEASSDDKPVESYKPGEYLGVAIEPLFKLSQLCPACISELDWFSEYE